MPTEHERADSPGRGFAKVLRPRYSIVDWVIFSLAFLATLGAFAWIQTRRLNQLSAATFQSPLPAIKVAEEGIVPDSRAYKQRYNFTTDWFTPNIPVWEKVLTPYRGRPGVRYLEIGLYEGRSALWMLENVLTDPTARLTGIDVFEGPLKNRFFANLKRSGAADKAQVLIVPSQASLRTMPFNEFDIIYIDGSHATSDVLEDAVLSWRLLKPGGLMIFDDYRWAGCFNPGKETKDSPKDLPKIAIDRFVQCFKGKLEVIHNSYQLILRKMPDAA